ncbi:hypothetical protein AB0302_03110 [Micrococcus sp. NPDC078436]|uniref:hypothetical protein n=1 Tax=Micrococcus sp. NPDC078436 TaxID=3154960 RepID=UPI00344EEE35
MTSGSEPTPVSPRAHAGASDRHPYVVRRAPRLAAVLTLAGVLGLLAALAITAVVHASPTPVADPYSGQPVTFGTTFGYMALACLVAAALLGLLAWLLMDRRSRTTVRTVVLERTDDPAQADVSLNRHEADALRRRESGTSLPEDPAAPAERTPQQ